MVEVRLAAVKRDGRVFRQEERAPGLAPLDAEMRSSRMQG